MVSQDLPERIRHESLQTVQQTVGQLEEEQQLFQSFIEEMLDGLEAFRLDLCQREAILTDTKAELSARQSEMDQALEEIHGKAEVHASQRTQLEQLSAKLEECRQQTAELERERNEAHTQLEQTVSELDSMAHTLEGVETTRRELDKTREELRTVSEQLREKTENGQGQVDELRQEKQELQDELLTTREQAERLSQKVDEQDEQLIALREQLSRELQELREAMDQRDGALRDAAMAADEFPQGHVKDEPNTEGAPDKSSSTASKSVGEDPVLDSVLARFAELEETTRILEDET